MGTPWYITVLPVPPHPRPRLMMAASSMCKFYHNGKQFYAYKHERQEQKALHGSADISLLRPHILTLVRGMGCDSSNHTVQTLKDCLKTILLVSINTLGSRGRSKQCVPGQVSIASLTL